MFTDVCDLCVILVKKTLQELKQLFFEMADSVFGTANRYGYGCDSVGYNKVLQDYYGVTMKMSDVTEPK